MEISQFNEELFSEELRLSEKFHRSERITAEDTWDLNEAYLGKMFDGELADDEKVFWEWALSVALIDLKQRIQAEDFEGQLDYPKADYKLILAYLKIKRENFGLSLDEESFFMDWERCWNSIGVKLLDGVSFLNLDELLYLAEVAESCKDFDGRAKLIIEAKDIYVDYEDMFVAFEQNSGFEGFDAERGKSLNDKLFVFREMVISEFGQREWDPILLAALGGGLSDNLSWALKE